MAPRKLQVITTTTTPTTTIAAKRRRLWNRLLWRGPTLFTVGSLMWMYVAYVSSYNNNTQPHPSADSLSATMVSMLPVALFWLGCLTTLLVLCTLLFLYDAIAYLKYTVRERLYTMGTCYSLDTILQQALIDYPKVCLQYIVALYILYGHNTTVHQRTQVLHSLLLSLSSSSSNQPFPDNKDRAAAILTKPGGWMALLPPTWQMEGSNIDDDNDNDTSDDADSSTTTSRSSSSDNNNNKYGGGPYSISPVYRIHDQNEPANNNKVLEPPHTAFVEWKTTNPTNSHTASLSHNENDPAHLLYTIFKENVRSTLQSALHQKILQPVRESLDTNTSRIVVLCSALAGLYFSFWKNGRSRTRSSVISIHTLPRNHHHQTLVVALWRTLWAALRSSPTLFWTAVAGWAALRLSNNNNNNNHSRPMALSWLQNNMGLASHQWVVSRLFGGGGVGQQRAASFPWKGVLLTILLWYFRQRRRQQLQQ